MSAKTLRSEKTSFHAKGKKTKPNRKRKESRPLLIPGTIRRWTVRCAGVLTLAILLIFLHDLTTQSAYFEVRSIRISGTDFLDRQSVLEQAAIHHKANLLDLNLRHVRMRLENHPWIHKAALNRKLPGTLEIEVQEEKPYVILEPAFAPDSAFWADSSGRIFKQVSEEDPKNYPRVRGLPLPDADENALWFTRVRTLITLMHTPPVVLDHRSDTVSLWVDPELGLGLADTDIASQIIFGFSDYEEKTRRLRVLLHYRRTHHHTEAVDTIDLVRPDRVVVIPAAA
ncbi:FtsQ-type POTRA domain-containing protein [Desulfobotulus sp. H1]|uniref:FtsQ-type POTRA domain-containing protein n=1 Tax=Desulfobotulus pelophilus TaxID=2823377 RepID=A0ABT3N5W1_9BACT|nr:FtsQ-type POTRA domain-containing protein [Desulfobotulus pelophilus]MCW7752551.1 FtsQ-type POTRA domain-containing protein [Desulfobotulus pelophilus]